MLGNLMDPRGLAAVMPSQTPGLPAVDPSSLAQTMGNLMPPGAGAPPPPQGPAPAAPIPGGNLMPTPPAPPRPNLLPPSADASPPVIPATAHEAPIDKRQAFNYIMGIYNTVSGAGR